MISKYTNKTFKISKNNIILIIYDGGFQPFWTHCLPFLDLIFSATHVSFVE